jgi:hypothetical protein
MAADEVLLKFEQFVGCDPLIGQLPEARIDSVHGAVGGEDLLQAPAGTLDAMSGWCGDIDPAHLAAEKGGYIIQRQSGPTEVKYSHGTEAKNLEPTAFPPGKLQTSQPSGTESGTLDALRLPGPLPDAVL